MREALEKGQPDGGETEKVWVGKEDELRRMFGLN